MAPDLAASVRVRLLSIAKSEATDVDTVLVRYALERFLYRLGQSAHVDRFVLKGAMLFHLWYAMVVLGMTNTRMKDYLDLWVLLNREALDAGTLTSAIAATFARRETPLPTEPPIGLSDEFANDGTRQALWAAFLRKNALEATPRQDVVGALRTKLQPVLCTPMA